MPLQELSHLFRILKTHRLGEVTLRDFKAAVDRQGSFRYHFKALDPEFGTVKEEVGPQVKLQAFAFFMFIIALASH